MSITITCSPQSKKKKRKRLFSKMADAAKDYIEQRLLDENKLNE